MLFRKLFKLRRAHHLAVVRHDLAAKACRIEACKACQIRRRFRMPRAAQNAALDGAQREYMAGTAEGRRLRRRIQHPANRLAAFKSRNPRARLDGVNGNRKGGFMVVRIVRDHRADIELVKTLAVDRRADQPLRVLRHEIDVLRRNRFRRHDEVALVLPILIVYNKNHLAVPNILDRLFHRCKIRHVYTLLTSIRKIFKIPAAAKTPV